MASQQAPALVGQEFQGTVAMLVGNTGVGKSSAGCRLLGFKPFGNSARPFEVAATSNAVTTKIQKQDGFWLGDPHFPLRVIDTPGLNDPQGPHVDTLNMAKIGRYLDQEPVNCVLFVLSDGNPRIDHVMKRLINIVIQKVDKQDYDKLGFIVNRYKNDDAAKSERQELADGQSEADIKNRKRGEIKASLQEYSNQDLNLIPEDIERFVKRVFFLNSHFLESKAAEGDADAFVQLRDWCLICDTIHRGALAEGVAPINQDLQAAQDQAQQLEQAFKTAEEKHQKDLLEKTNQAAAEKVAIERQEAAAAIKAAQIEQKHCQGVAELRCKGLEQLIEALRKQQGQTMQNSFPQVMAKSQVHSELRKVEDQLNALPPVVETAEEAVKRAKTELSCLAHLFCSLDFSNREQLDPELELSTMPELELNRLFKEHSKLFIQQIMDGMGGCEMLLSPEVAVKVQQELTSRDGLHLPGHCQPGAIVSLYNDLVHSKLEEPSLQLRLSIFRLVENCLTTIIKKLVLSEGVQQIAIAEMRELLQDQAHMLDEHVNRLIKHTKSWVNTFNEGRYLRKKERMQKGLTSFADSLKSAGAEKCGDLASAAAELVVPAQFEKIGNFTVVCA
ncbi:TPA: hypothetical protein ACH3X2_007419 [Trebouxia sp. C0005]